MYIDGFTESIKDRQKIFSALVSIPDDSTQAFIASFVVDYSYDNVLARSYSSYAFSITTCKKVTDDKVKLLADKLREMGFEVTYEKKVGTSFLDDDNRVEYWIQVNYHLQKLSENFNPKALAIVFAMTLQNLFCSLQ